MPPKTFSCLLQTESNSQLEREKKKKHFSFKQYMHKIWHLYYEGLEGTCPSVYVCLFVYVFLCVCLCVNRVSHNQTKINFPY